MISKISDSKGIMKKLKLLGLLLLSNLAFAGQITHTDYTSGATITASGQNTNENTIVNEINGNLDSTNIEAGGISVTNLSSSVQASFVPTGTFFYWAGSQSSVPTGYLYCDGSAVSRTTYATLFNVIGESFGQGDNATTFNLPDTRGYFVRGLSDGTARDPNAATRTAAATGGNTGDNVGSVETSSITSHTHTASSAVTDPGHTHAGRTYTTTGSNGGFPVGQTGTEQGASPQSGLAVSNTTGITVATTNTSTGGSETRPLNINLAGIIKY